MYKDSFVYSRTRLKATHVNGAKQGSMVVSRHRPPLSQGSVCGCPSSWGWCSVCVSWDLRPSDRGISWSPFQTTCGETAAANSPPAPRWYGPCVLTCYLPRAEEPWTDSKCYVVTCVAAGFTSHSNHRKLYGGVGASLSALGNFSHLMSNRAMPCGASGERNSLYWWSIPTVGDSAYCLKSYFYNYSNGTGESSLGEGCCIDPGDQ